MNKFTVLIVIIALFGAIFAQKAGQAPVKGVKTEIDVPCKTLIANKRKECSSLILSAQKGARDALDLLTRIESSVLQNKSDLNLNAQMNNLKTVQKTALETTKVIFRAKDCIDVRKKLQRTCLPICKRKQARLGDLIKKLRTTLRTHRGQRCSDVNDRIEDLKERIVRIKRRLVRADSAVRRAKETKLEGLIHTLRQVREKCENGAPIVSCPKLVTACTLPGVPDAKRNQALDLAGRAVAAKEQLSKLKNKKSKAYSALLAQINKWETAAKALSVPTKRQLCQQSVERIVRTLKARIIQAKAQSALEKDAKKKAALAVQIRSQQLSLRKMIGRWYVCAIKRVKINISNCRFWTKLARNLKINVKKSTASLAKLDQKNVNYKNLKNHIEAQNKKIALMMIKIKECSLMVNRKKVCMSALKKCSDVSSACKKRCGKNQLCVLECNRSKSDCKSDARDANKCPKSAFETKCYDECRHTANCRSVCKKSTSSPFKVCAYNCLHTCRRSCEKKARNVKSSMSLYMRCNRYLTKQSYIQYLQSRVDIKKKRAKTPQPTLQKIEASLAVKRRRVQEYLTKNKCTAARKNPFCSRVQVQTKCSASNDVQGKTMRSIRAQIASLTKQKASLCKKPKKAAKKPVKVVPVAPKVAAKKPIKPVLVPKVPTKKPVPVNAGCAQLATLKNQIKSTYDQKAKLAQQLRDLNKQYKAKKTPITKEESLAKDRLSQMNQNLKNTLISLLRQARQAKQDCDKKKK